MMSKTVILQLLCIFGFSTRISGQGYGNSGSVSGTGSTGANCPSTGSGSTSTGFSPTHLRVAAGPDHYYTAANASLGTQDSGFLVDLLNALQSQAGITYTLTARPDLHLGTQNPNGSFDGSLIQLLLNNETDLIATDLTILSNREAVVDFLVPFSTYKLQMLVNSQFGINDGVQYLIRDDADLAYVKNSTNATVQAIAANIEAGRNGSIVKSDSDGLAKVLTGNFAYITESPFPDKAVAQNAGKVSRLSDNLGTFYLAMAVQQGSPLRKKLNIALEQLEENGVVQSLLNKYDLNS